MLITLVHILTFRSLSLVCSSGVLLTGEGDSLKKKKIENKVGDVENNSQIKFWDFAGVCLHIALACFHFH